MPQSCTGDVRGSRQVHRHPLLQHKGVPARHDTRAMWVVPLTVADKTNVHVLPVVVQNDTSSTKVSCVDTVGYLWRVVIVLAIAGQSPHILEPPIEANHTTGVNAMPGGPRFSTSDTADNTGTTDTTSAGLGDNQEEAIDVSQSWQVGVRVGLVVMSVTWQAWVQT